TDAEQDRDKREDDDGTFLHEGSLTAAIVSQSAAGSSLTLWRIRCAPANLRLRVSALGTTMQRIPARVADSSPRSESSIATHAAGSTPLASTARGMVQDPVSHARSRRRSTRSQS